MICPHCGKPVARPKGVRRRREPVRPHTCRDCGAPITETAARCRACANSVHLPERDAEIAMLASSGLTLQAVGDAVGLTRERVRQIVVRSGVKRMPITTIDPLAIARCAKRGLTRHETATELGVSLSGVSRVGHALRLNFAGRYHTQARVLRREMVVVIRRLYGELGRSPSHREIAVAMGKTWPRAKSPSVYATIWMANLWGMPRREGTRSRSYARYCHRAYHVAGVPVRTPHSPKRGVGRAVRAAAP
jgi:hypothetical protein